MKVLGQLFFKSKLNFLISLSLEGSKITPSVIGVAPKSKANFLEKQKASNDKKPYGESSNVNLGICRATLLPLAPEAIVDDLSIK